MRINGKSKICLIIGDPVEHTLSPMMHNSAYETLGIDDQFVYLAARVSVGHVKKAVTAMRIMGFRGLTCTLPHKLEVMKYLDKVDKVARKIGAVNTVVNENGVLYGYNTDWLGTVTPLEKITSLKGKKVAIIGAGGVSRAIAFGVIEKGVHLKIFNRTYAKAERLARELGAKAGRLTDNRDIQSSDIVINATSLGMAPNENESPILPDCFHNKQIVFDAVYVPYETKFLKDAKIRGARIIHGTEMLLYQGIAQFEYYTNLKAPEDIMRKTLFKHFNIK